jgi:hypothetical protein
MEPQNLEKISLSKPDASLLLNLRAVNRARLEGYAAGMRDAEVHLARLLAERKAEEASDGVQRHLSDNS